MKGIAFTDLMPQTFDKENEPDISVVQLMRAGKYKYYDGSELDISVEVLRQMKRNFDANVKKVDLAVDYYHHSHLEAAGWIREVILKENDTQLWIAVDWTETGKQKILSREVRYLSADFERDYEDNETGERYGYTLNGGGLTNRPFIKNMSAILSELSAVDMSPENRQTITRILSERPVERNLPMDFSELKKEVFALSEDQKKELIKLCGGETQVIKLSEENKKLSEDLVSMRKENLELSSKLATQTKEAEFAVLLSEGKAVAAQKEAFMKGDIAEFTKLATAVNFSEHGNGATPPAQDGEPKTPSEAQDKICQLADAKMKDNENLSFTEASRLVRDENPKLAEMAAR